MVLNKADLADEEVTLSWIRYFKRRNVKVVATDTLRRSGFKKLYSAIQAANKKSTVKPTRCMIVGIPNVGKSSLINQLVGKKKLKATNTPGETRKKAWQKANKSLELLDTPGVLQPKFKDVIIGTKLAILGSIKSELLDFEQLALVLIKYLSKRYPNRLKIKYEVDPNLPPMEVLEKIAQYRGFLISGGNLNIDRSARTFINEFRRGAIGRLSLEEPKGEKDFWL